MRRRVRVRNGVILDGGIPWLKAGQCYETEVIDGVDDTVRVRLYSPDGKQSSEVASSILTDSPPCP